jgi:hypothetical protein
MAKAATGSRQNRESLRRQVGSVVRAAQLGKQRTAGKTVPPHLGFLKKLHIQDKALAAEVAKQYDVSDKDITNPALLSQIKELDIAAKDLKTTLDDLADEASKIRKHK